MIIQVSCAIKDCPKVARVDAKEYSSARFTLCSDCEQSVVLDFIINMELHHHLAPKSAANFAVAFNAFRRERRGASITHRSGVVTTMKEMNVEAPRIISGSG